MRPPHRLLSCAIVLLAGGLRPVLAQDPPPRKLTFTGDLGFVNTAGNTSVTTLSLGDKLVWRPGKASFTQVFALIYGRSEGEENAGSLVFRGRLDYPLGDRISAYGFAGYERNKFAGIARRFDEGVGLALKVWRHPKNQLDVEAGLGLVQDSRYLTGTSGATDKRSFVAGRAATVFKHLFTAAAYLQQSLEFLPNFEESDDYRINSESALVAPISAHFGLKAAYLVKFINAPLSPDLKKTDRMFTTGVQVTY